MCDPFKFVRNPELPQVKCKQCGSRDTCWRLAQCANLEFSLSSNDPEPTAQFLVYLATGDLGLNPGRPIPRVDEELIGGDKLELAPSQRSSSSTIARTSDRTVVMAEGKCGRISGVEMSDEKKRSSND